MSSVLRNVVNEIKLVPESYVIGKVNSVRGLLIEAIGIEFAVSF